MTGRVKETFSSGRCLWSLAIACERRATEAESVSSSPSMSKSARLEPAASSALPWAAARSTALSQVAASSLPEAPPKETRTSAPSFFRRGVRDFTAGSPIFSVPFHLGVQPPPSEITKVRLYVDGEPAESVSDASVALT